jgi:hypothetical protein
VPTILIARREHLQALQESGEFEGSQAFSDDDALRALEAITRNPPNVVALERLFAATTRGAALINRIKADPMLAACEIRIVAHDSLRARVPAAGADSVTAAAAVAIAEPAPTAAGLDRRGTRRVPRVKIIDGVEVNVDGNVALLVDLSTLGAQVVSATILKPNQRVRLALADGKRPVRISGSVAWAVFELAATGPRYRAGIEFADADAEAIRAFCEAKKR